MWYLTHNALHGFPPKFNMAANRASTIEGWGNVFEELLLLMTDYEAFYDSTDLRLRENKVIRMESALLALQQVITLVIQRRLDCASVLQEIFNNVRILFLELTRRRETQTGSPCSNLAIYSLEMPKVERSGRPGRPRFEISEDVLLELRSYWFYVETSCRHAPCFKMDYKKTCC